MEIFRKYKLLILFFIIFSAVIIMWGWSVVVQKEIFTPVIKTFANLVKKKGLSFPPKEKIYREKKVKKAPEEVALERPAIPVRITKVMRIDFTDVMTSFGTIKGFGEIPIRFKESARISKFYFKEGDSIRQNDAVVSQEQDEEKLKLEYAKIEYEKNKKLYELGAMTKDRLRQAELELESAELGLKKRNFYAPSDGFMGTRNVNESELAAPDDIVATFLDLSSVFCEVGIIEREIGKVKVGQNVKIMFEAFANDAYEGIVDSVSPMVEGRSRTQTVRILIPNEGHLIKPGMFARAQITTFEKKDAVVIPTKALKKTDEGYVVFGVVRDTESPKKTQAGFEEAVAKIIPVKIENISEDLALIGEGLSEGEEIVLESPEGKASIEDGGKIEIIEGLEEG